MSELYAEGEWKLTIVGTVVITADMHVNFIHICSFLQICQVSLFSGTKVICARNLSKIGPFLSEVPEGHKEYTTTSSLYENSKVHSGQKNCYYRSPT